LSRNCPLATLKDFLYERGIGVAIYLAQLPPAELARLKAELAETLIANFCFPRFFDYRTNSLRMRPVDRAKRQDVWMFLSSYDFNSWNRIDIMSPDFHQQVERLLIQYVQRNRSFFGEQGRKRMTDVRMLITNSSTTVAEGLRGHLNNRPKAHPPFGSPRPAISWMNSRVTGKPDLSWEQIANATTLLQQQLQELRGEASAPIANDVYTSSTQPLNGSNNAAAVPPKRSPRHRPISPGSGKVETVTQHPVQPVPFTRPAPQEVRTTNPLPGPRSTNPLSSPSGQVMPTVPAEAATPPASHAAALISASSTPSAPAERRVEQVVIPGELPLPPAVVENKATAVQHIHLPEQAARPAPSEPRELSARASLVEVPASRPESSRALVSDEDIVIFEQLRHQLVVWLRIEAVRLGMDASGQNPAQLTELLEQQEGFDETRLQVVSTLLNLCEQVISHGYATLIEYKQAMMFYLMHTRRAR
jgi:hypothetical protein